MFVEGSKVLVASDNYIDTIEYPINIINKNSSILSYNFQQKMFYYSHLSDISVKPVEHNKMVEIEAINTNGILYTVQCHISTQVATVKYNKVQYIHVFDLKNNGSILLDKTGAYCKIINIKPYLAHERKTFNVISSKSDNIIVNGLIFRTIEE